MGAPYHRLHLAQYGVRPLSRKRPTHENNQGAPLASLAIDGE
jgi:hypothetical protein